MPLFVTYASYSNAGIKGIMDKPIDRTEAIKAVVEKAGGKLLAAYMTTGPHDVVVITEMPDGSDAVAVGMAANASGAVAKIETVRAWTLGEFKGIAEKASRYATAYVPPGR
ncbi:GYD domain-containing protein [Bradyrhizobium erythrophlei]|uniref:GYD domain-containing protein n=1 Tax=Bradyrhizobium erythrophlei TaxID=1437360 RepID=UPI0035EA1E18